LTAVVGVQSEANRLRRRGQLLIVGAAVAWSTAGVLQRELSVDTATQVAGRAFIAFLALLAFVAFSNRGGTVDAFRTMGKAGLAVAACTAIASGAFIIALNHSTVANVLFIQAVAPVAAGLLAWIAFGESITRRAGVAMVVALVGVGLMVGGPDSGGVFGVGAAIVMALAFSVAIVITRHKRDVSMAPAICLSQLVLVLVSAPFAEIGTITQRDLGLLLLLGVGQMGLGLAFLTAGARLIPASEVALITLLEVVLGPLWVWISISETPALATLVGGVVVVIAVLIQTTEKTRAPVLRSTPSSEPSRA
jgi:drug/metabolite transporter (DMT)-like permease